MRNLRAARRVTMARYGRSLRHCATQVKYSASELIKLRGGMWRCIYAKARKVGA